jgi:hypothetical protein
VLPGTLSRRRLQWAGAPKAQPSWAGPAGREHPATQTPKRDLRLYASAAAVVMLVNVIYLTAWPSPAPARPLPPGLSRLHSGLLVADPLDRLVTLGQLQDQYVLDGSAGPKLGSVSETPAGLAVGIKAHHGWAGWFASTIHAAGPAVAWHAVISPTALQLGTKGRGIAVFAVQTATTQKTGVINYIVVAAVSRSGSYHWLVGYAHGLVAGASTQVLWASKWQPVQRNSVLLASQAVTVVTDGSHSLSVWFGTDEIFSSDRLVLKMPAPFQAYLEVQSSAPAYSARFNDFWVADDAPLVLRGLPEGSRVELNSAIDAHGAVAGAVAGAVTIATAEVGREGTATLRLPAPELVGTGTIKVATGGKVTDLTNVPYAGGDVLSWARPS